MTAREAIFANIRRSLGVTGAEAPRRFEVEARLAKAPAGVVPRRGQGDVETRVATFKAEAERAQASVAYVASLSEVPAEVARFLRDNNCPATLRMGSDERLAAMPWSETSLEILRGPSDGHDLNAVSAAFAGIAETGTLALVSGAENPTTLKKRLRQTADGLRQGRPVNGPRRLEARRSGRAPISQRPAPSGPTSMSRSIGWSRAGDGRDARPRVANRLGACYHAARRFTDFGILMRKGAVARQTKETNIEVGLDLDGSGVSDISTGVGFFDHMLDQLARHSLIDLTVRAEGDRHIDDHHTVEDVGIALGQALAIALGDKKGLARYADCLLPMDETLTRVALDVSGRPFLVFRTEFPTERIGSFDAQLVREFFQAFAGSAGLTLHIETLYGVNSHHIAESCFKGVARALKAAVAIDPRQAERVPSTKGAL